MATSQHDAAASLNHLYEDYWEFILHESPTYATYLGDHRYDDRLDDVSAEAYHRRIDRLKKYLDQLKSLRRPVGQADRLNYDLFQRELALQIEGANLDPYLTPISQQTGPHIDLPQLITFHPYKTRQDFDNYISRLRQFPRVFDQTIANLKTGMEKRSSSPES